MSMFDYDRETLIALGVPADAKIVVEADDDVSLDARIAGHDWYYWSDRNEVVRDRGERARKRIVVELERIPVERAIALWREYAPPRWVFPIAE